MSFKLIIKKGPSPGQVIEVTQQEFIIGREAGAELVISSPVVSRRHARILQVDDGHTIEDLGSSNGTSINGERISSRVKLNSGDLISFGQAILILYETPTPTNEIESLLKYIPTKVAAAPGDAQGRSVAETTLGDDLGSPQPGAPTQFVVEVAGKDAQAYSLTEDNYTIGRGTDNDIVVPSRIVSAHHARLEKLAGGYQITPLPEASNPVYFGGRPLKTPRMLQHDDKLRIGSQDPGLMVSFTFQTPTQPRSMESRQIVIGDRSVLSFGRDAGNDVVLDAPNVSRFHARIERVGKRYRIKDLRSSNGTYVNDQQVLNDVWLKSGDAIRVGPYRFMVGVDQLTQHDESDGLRVDAIGLNKWVRKDLNILQDISFVIQPREFVVVVGQSGGGKSTLVDAIAGYRPATDGKVLVNDIDVYRNFNAIRSEIGYVPQKDIIHNELTIYEALDYAAQLRMPPDTTKDERHKRVMEVLEDLDLTHRKEVQISGLSGGQQKRVSIGVELLTKPGLFFLDEPTSGLDPGTETSLMHLMRRLADQGRTIVLITHATKNVMLADKVLFLARGGYLTWYGPPDEALEYFDQYRSAQEQRTSEMEFDEIYAVLEDTAKGSPEQWAERFQAHTAYQRYIAQPLESKGAAGQPQSMKGDKKEVVSRRNQVSAARQFTILSSRNIKILTRDRFSLVLMLAVAPIVGLLDVVLSMVLGKTPFDFHAGNVAEATTTLFLLTIFGVMVGGLSQMREFVKEADIYKRERLVNLKIFPYVLSKTWVAALLALYQAAAYTIIRYLAYDMPGGIQEFALIYITLVLATMGGMMLGLFASALSPTPNAAPMLVIIFILPQIVLGGALIPLPDMVSAPTSTRWAFQAFMGITGVGSHVAADACWTLPAELRSTMSIEDKDSYNCRCMGANIFDAQSCNFPGVGVFYDPALEQPPPPEPDPLPDPPPEPLISPPPPEPADQSDAVAVADYLDALQDYQSEVEEIQNDYKAQVEGYQAQAGIYQAELISFQEAMARYQIARNASVGKAEALIGNFNEDFGWTFVDKDDTPAFWTRLASTWLAQGLIITILFVAILFLMKRKDVV